MSVQVFLILITVFATITSILTEAVKKFLDSQKITYASNIVVLVIAFIVGFSGTAIYYVNMGIEFSVINIIYLFLISLANWVGAMVGYDKIIQLLKQLEGK